MNATLRLSASDVPDRGAHAAEKHDLEIVELDAQIGASVDLERVTHAFGDEAPNWLGLPFEAGADGSTGYLCDLELRVSPESRALFRKSAIVRVGPLRRTGAGWVIPIEWRAATLAPLFPVFVGSLVVEKDRIAIQGHYAPPFGAIGYVIDRAVLSMAARATARWFIAKVAGVVG
jgi:hypothetical protein